jgi:hypothetical protein
MGDATYLGTLDGGEPVRISDGFRRIVVRPAAGRSAYLLGIEAAGLIAQPFDLDAMRATGAAITLIAGASAASASAQGGVLATSLSGSRPVSVPTWFDRRST